MVGVVRMIDVCVFRSERERGFLFCCGLSVLML
jgi:hypothetical protein